MKTYYKTILMGETANPDPIPKQSPNDVREYALLEMEPPCCNEMKEALDNEAIGFGEFHDTILNRDHNINFSDCHPYPEGAVWEEYQINFCPFCGQKVETEEREKVTLKKVSRRHRITTIEHEEVAVIK